MSTNQTRSAVERRAAVSSVKKNKKSDPYFLRAVGKAIEVQEILKRSSEPLALTQLASRLKLTKSSALRVLHTLEVSRYIRKIPDGRYTVSHNGASGAASEFVERLVLIASSPLRELVREFRETVGLAVLFGNHIEVVSVVESPELVRMGNTVGRILPPHASSLGKCITAYQSEERRERLLRSYGIVRITPKTIVDEVELKREFDRIAQRGYAIDEEESTPYGCCIAAPVFTPDGDVMAAISISPPSSRMPEHDRQKMIAAVMRTARTISDGLKPS